MVWRRELDLPRRWGGVAPPWLIECGVSLVMSVLAVGARMAIDHFVSGVVPFALVFPAVVGSAVLGGWRAGLLTIVICQTFAWYFILGVRHSFVIASPADGVSLVVTTFAQLVLLWATVAARRGAQTAENALAEQSRLYLQTLDQQSEIKNGQESLGAIFNRSADGMTFCRLLRDADGAPIDYLILNVNAAHALLVGIPVEEMINRPISSIAPSRDARWLQSAERVVETGEPQQFEVHSPSTGRWLEIRVSPVVDLLFAQTFIDITERKTAQKERDRASELLQTFLKAVPGVVYVKDKEGRMLVANQGVADLVGKPFDAFIGRTDLEFLDGKDQALAVMATDQRIMKSGQTEVLEENVALPGGVPAVWLSTKTPLRDENGDVVGLIGSSIDFTEQSRARALLARSQEELEAEVDRRTKERDRLWRNSQDLLLVADDKTTMVSVNPAWTRVLGWTENELIGASFMDLVHPEDLEATRAQAAYLSVEGRSSMQFQNRYRTKDGDWRRLSWAVTSEDSLLHAVARDVTVEQQAVEALHQAQKMDAVGQLTGGIAHDFNNLLTVITGSLDLLRRRVGSDARTLRHLDLAADASRRAAVLTQRLLAFSRRQPLKPEVVDANRLVAGMSDLLDHALGENVRVETSLGQGLWPTYIDPNQLESVILNLAVNGRDAMDGRGVISIETQNTHLDARYVEAHTDVAPGPYVLIAVTDSGAGMAPEISAKAFDPFFTTKPVGKGTGLGLSQVYGFVKQSGGHVKIYSELGQGTTIKVYIPRHDLSVASEVLGAQSSEMQGSKARTIILVVEDEESVRQFSVDALDELGYLVIAAGDASSALQILSARDDISLMFTDVVMPEVNGAELAEKARKLHPDLKVLFTSGFTKNAMVNNGVLDPGVNLIGKPFSIDALGAQVRALLAS